MQNDQMIGQSQNEIKDQKTTILTNEKEQIECQQPITSSYQQELQYSQPGWFPYQMPMMPMPCFAFGQGMKSGQGDFYVRKSKEEQQLQNQQQYAQMFDPSQFGYQGFMPMLPMMPFFPMNYYQSEQLQENDQEEKENQQKQKRYQEKQQQQQQQERNYRNQKYQKKYYRPKYGKNQNSYQPQQQQQQKTEQTQQVEPKPQKQFQLQQQQQQPVKQRIRIDSDSFPALPESKFIYKKKEVQGQDQEEQKEKNEENNSIVEQQQQQLQQQQQKIFSESKIFYDCNEIKNIFVQLKSADQIKLHDNLRKLDSRDVPIIFAEGCLQLEVISPSKIAKRKEEKSDVYYEKEKVSKRKNTYDNSKVMSRHKFSLQITTYEKKEVK